MMSVVLFEDLVIRKEETDSPFCEESAGLRTNVSLNGSSLVEGRHFFMIKECTLPSARKSARTGIQRRTLAILSHDSICSICSVRRKWISKLSIWITSRYRDPKPTTPPGRGHNDHLQKHEACPVQQVNNESIHNQSSIISRYWGPCPPMTRHQQLHLLFPSTRFLVCQL